MPGLDVVCSVVPGHGHFLPFVALLDELVERGHRVRVATSEGFRDAVEERGFELLPVGAHYTQTTMRDDPEDLAETMFVRSAPIVRADLDEAVGDDPPDVVIVEPFEFGAIAWAAEQDIPQVGVLNTLAPPVGLAFQPLDPARRGPSGSPMSRGWQRLVADAGLGRLGLDRGEAPYHRWLTLSMVPPSLRPEPLEWSSHVSHPLRPEPSPVEVDMAWLDEVPRDRPWVAVTLGTLFGRAENHRVIVQAILEVGARALVATKVDLGDDLGDRVHVQPWVSVPTLAAACDAVVHHGGWGTTIDCLSAGTPAVLTPLGADQAFTANAVARCGAGAVLWSDDRSPGRLAEALRACLQDPFHGLAARRVAAEISSMPGAHAAAALIEDLASTRRPVLNGGLKRYLE